MAAADQPFEMPLLAPPRLRHKSARRRLGREARLFGPFFSLGIVAVLALGITAGIERFSPAPSVPTADVYASFELAYSAPAAARISISSTSNVSAAPPGILGGAPLSP